ncbi:MAG TPA: hypothetical protein VGI86_08405 [Acidimicrobiia bacterium]
MTDGALTAADPTVRARAAAIVGHSGRWPRGMAEALSALVHSDPAPAVREAALRALVRRAHPSRALASWRVATQDLDAGMRRAAATVAPGLAARAGAPGVAAPLITLLDDRDALVAEASAFALGEVVSRALDAPTAHAVVDALARHAADHSDALVREACVAALGSLRGADVEGTAAALGVLLAAARDKPAIRRRAVIALSAFDDPAAERAIQDALTDRDWQVRQLAEDLLA